MPTPSMTHTTTGPLTPAKPSSLRSAKSLISAPAHKARVSEANLAGGRGPDGFAGGEGGARAPPFYLAVEWLEEVALEVHDRHAVRAADRAHQPVDAVVAPEALAPVHEVRHAEEDRKSV